MSDLPPLHNPPVDEQLLLPEPSPQPQAAVDFGEQEPQPIQAADAVPDAPAAVAEPSEPPPLPPIVILQRLDFQVVADAAEIVIRLRVDSPLAGPAVADAKRRESLLREIVADFVGRCDEYRDFEQAEKHLQSLLAERQRIRDAATANEKELAAGVDVQRVHELASQAAGQSAATAILDRAILTATERRNRTAFALYRAAKVYCRNQRLLFLGDCDLARQVFTKVLESATDVTGGLIAGEWLRGAIASPVWDDVQARQVVSAMIGGEIPHPPLPAPEPIKPSIDLYSIGRTNAMMPTIPGVQ